MEKTLLKKTVAVAFLIISMFSIAFTSTASAAGSITLSTNAQAPGGAVTVTGTGFGASKAIALGFGPEVVVSGEAHPITNTTGPGPFMTKTSRYPLKPGSFSFHCVVSSDTNVVESDYTDNGDGTLATTNEYSVNHSVNYVTGVFGRGSTSDWSTFTVVYTAKYTSYQYNVTPAGGITTSPAGAFTAIITVPAGLSNGSYNVTALDTGGARAVAALTVDTAIPEGLPLGSIMMLTIFAVAVGSWCLRKRPAFPHNRA